MTIQTLSPNISTSSLLGQALGQGISAGAQPVFEQMYNQSRLSKAFEQLQPGANFIEQLKSVAPALLTTPGGAQALSELAPVLGKYAESEAVRRVIDARRQQSGQPAMGQTPGQAEAQQQVPGAEQPQQIQVQPSVQDKFLRPTPPTSPETLHPPRTAQFQPQPEMSQRDVERFATDLMEQSLAGGKPLSYAEALPIAQNTAAQIAQSNERIKSQQKQQEEAIDKLNEGLVRQAANSGLIKSPEDETIVKKFAYQARNAHPGTDQWEYVRTKMRQYDAAKNELTRTYTTPDVFQSAYRKLLGTYKNKEQAIKDLQPALKKYRDLGLFDEARSTLTDVIGLGPEDAETALFPLNESQNKNIDSIPKNKIKEPEFSKTAFVPNVPDLEFKFPGEAWKMDTDQFSSFKEDLFNTLKNNPDMNLLALRGKLNQEKRYAWQDISRALSELVDEKRFDPNVEQDKQLAIVRQPPIPGLAEQFKFLMKGTK